MKGILSLVCLFSLASFAGAQERVAVWTVPSPQTVAITVNVTANGMSVDQKYVTVNVPAGGTVTITKHTPQSSGLVASPATCPCIAASRNSSQYGFCPCADPFSAAQSVSTAPAGYRMVCNGNSCSLVPVGQASAMGTMTYTTYADASDMGVATTRVGPFRRILGRIFKGKSGASAGGCCGN